MSSSSPFIWGPNGNAHHLGHGHILGKDGLPLFPLHNFGIIQTDYGDAPVAQGRSCALTLTSQDHSIRIEGLHDQKAVNFVISKEWILNIVEECLKTKLGESNVRKLRDPVAQSSSGNAARDGEEKSS